MQIGDQGHGPPELVDSGDGGGDDSPVESGLLQAFVDQRQFFKHLVGGVLQELGLERGEGAETPLVPVGVPLDGDLPNRLDLAQMLLQLQQVVGRRQIHAEDQEPATNLGLGRSKLGGRGG